VLWWCRVWDFASEDCMQVLKGHRKAVLCVAISPDGKTVVSGSNDKTVRWVPTA
jgi:COMPASS component SWD3